MFRLALVSSALLIVAGCASEPTAAPVATAAAPTQVVVMTTDDRKMVCEKDAPTGSALRATHCHAQQTDAERAASLDAFMHGPHNGPTDPGH